jgi:hypothetical protein
MKAYGEEKRMHKIHPHNECGVCAENSIRDRGAIKQKVKKEIDFEIAPKNFEKKLYTPITEREFIKKIKGNIV